MHERIAADLLESPPQEAEIVYLGDYIDRGPDSRGVIELLIGRAGRGDGIGKTFLLGNHEHGMLEFMRDPYSDLGSIWLDWGGRETLESYGFTLPPVVLPTEREDLGQGLARALPPSHRAFLEGLSTQAMLGDYLFAHAGVDPRKPLDQQALSDLTFIREPFLSWHLDPLYKPLPRKVVHGHTIAEEPQNLPHRVGVDTGAYAGGPLSCAVLEGESVRFLQVR
jgi:serine/threonine protein phosphatase 1